MKTKKKIVGYRTAPNVTVAIKFQFSNDNGDMEEVVFKPATKKTEATFYKTTQRVDLLERAVKWGYVIRVYKGE